ncbi:Ribosomal protein S3AE [Cupriavidus sp. H18C1]
MLRLTKEEEKRLIARLEDVQTLDDLRRMQEKMHALLGITVTIEPSIHGVRTVRGFNIELADQLGLCKKTRQTIPAAIRRCLERHPEIAYAILDAQGLLGEG